MGAVIGQDLSPVFSIIAEAFSHSIAYWIIIWWIFYHSFRNLTILCINRTWPTVPKSSWIEGYSVFFLLCIVLSIIGTAVNPLKDSYAVGSALVYGNIDEFGPNFIPGLIYEVIKIVSMYFTIHYISKYKLNLQ